MLRRVAAALSHICFALSGLWALAGALRYVFGVAVTVPLLPPLALDRVHVLPAFGMALWQVPGLAGPRMQSRAAPAA